ncbi:hypothetical protein NDU88_002526 [Pleurodeles waltl]|uniref:Uncharacterized protein n=1 Tax=Pleurodeles waltl TaxID=8319 RepID=A0AAV7TKS1_PLEWA|nr:hypothetical protein NDU88_002526 [Pleurodeles waltl]
MDILIRDAKKKREKLLLEINILEKEIQETNLSEAIEKNYAILKEVLRKHQDYVKDKKMCKLKRDANDYASGRVFTYSRKFDNINTERQGDKIAGQNPTTPLNTTTSDTDLSSSSSIVSEEASSSAQEQSTTTSGKSSFLLELERFCRGQKQTRIGQDTYRREPEEAKERMQQVETGKAGVTTRSASRNMKN